MPSVVCAGIAGGLTSTRTIELLHPLATSSAQRGRETGAQCTSRALPVRGRDADSLTWTDAGAKTSCGHVPVERSQGSWLLVPSPRRESATVPARLLRGHASGQSTREECSQREQSAFGLDERCERIRDVLDVRSGVLEMVHVLVHGRTERRRSRRAFLGPDAAVGITSAQELPAEVHDLLLREHKRAHASDEEHQLGARARYRLAQALEAAQQRWVPGGERGVVSRMMRE